MPTLQTQKTERFTLPSFETSEDKAWIELSYPAQMIDFENAQEAADLSPLKQSAFIMVSKVKDWNFANDEGVKLEITIDNILLLSPTDFVFVSQKLELDKIAKLSTQKKSN